MCGAVEKLYTVWFEILVGSVFPRKTTPPPTFEALRTRIKQTGLVGLFNPFPAIPHPLTFVGTIQNQALEKIQKKCRSKPTWGNFFSCAVFEKVYKPRLSTLVDGLARHEILQLSEVTQMFEQVYRKILEITSLLTTFNPFEDELILAELDHQEYKKSYTLHVQGYIDKYGNFVDSDFDHYYEDAEKVYQCLSKWFVTPERHVWMVQAARYQLFRAAEAARRESDRKKPGSTGDGTSKRARKGGRLYRLW